MKKIILSIAIIATAAIAGWNYQQNKQNVVLSDLALENVEALARGESGDGYMNQEYDCTKCGATFIGCFWCSEDPNYCHCTASGHSC